MDLQTFQRMMQIFPGVNDPSGGTGVGPGMMTSANVSPSIPDLDSYQPRTTISNKLTATLGDMPVRPDPSNLRKVGAAIAGFGAGGSAQAVVGGQPIGYKYDPKAADLASDKVKFGDFDNQLNDWQNQVKALGIGANEEDRANAGEVRRLAGNAKNEIDQQKIDVANKRADAYQQNADTKIKEEADKHEYSMQKLRDAVATADKKFAQLQKDYEVKKNNSEWLREYHQAELASIAARRAAQTEDDKFKLEDQKRRTDAQVELSRIRGEALKSGKETDTNYVYGPDGTTIISKRVKSGIVQKMVPVIDKNGMSGSVPEDKVDEFIRDHGGKRQD